MSAEVITTPTDTKDPLALDEEKKINADQLLNSITGKGAAKARKYILNQISAKGQELSNRFTDRKAIVIEPLHFPQHNDLERVYQYIDADKALEILLEHNTMNRPIKQDRVWDYGRQMITGEWLEANPDPIMFSHDKTLLNAQHRLFAVLAAAAIDPNIKIRFPVEFNHSKNIMKVLDQNAVRSTADKAVIVMKQGGEVPFDIKGRYKGVKVSNLQEIVNQMFIGKNVHEDVRIEFLHKHLDWIYDIYAVLKNVNKTFIRYNSSWAAAFAKAGLPNYFGKDTILPLAKRFADEQWLPGGGDPLKELFTRFGELKNGKQKLKPKERYGLTVKALRKALLGVKVKNLHVTFVDWHEEEARDYRVHGSNSSTLRAFSLKNHLFPPKKKKNDEDGDDPENLLDAKKVAAKAAEFLAKAKSFSDLAARLGVDLDLEDDPEA